MKPHMNMSKLMVDFDTEAECRAYMEALRWPKGIECPRCKGRVISRIRARDQFDCDSCRYQFSVTSGTIFHDSHLPLPKWFIATLLLCESRKGMSANQLSRILGTSYKTAWYLCHRIRAAMKDADIELLDGTIELDETYVGGKPRRHRPRREKDIVIGIRERNGQLRLIHTSDVKSGTIRKIMEDNVSKHVEVIMTDESSIYPWSFTSAQKKLHKTVCHKKEYVSGLVHTNTVESAFSLLKRGIIGTWHKVSTKHLQAYLEEMTFRFNNRKNPFLFRDTIKRLIDSPNLEYKKLTAAA